MSQQPEALRLADALEKMPGYDLNKVYCEAAFQLRHLQRQFDCLHAENDVLKAAWKPIETAPKDGTKVLLCKATDADGKPMKKESFGLFVQRAAWWGDEWIVYCSLPLEPMCFFEPTHWMQIPASPEM